MDAEVEIPPQKKNEEPSYVMAEIFLCDECIVLPDMKLVYVSRFVDFGRSGGREPRFDFDDD